MCYCQKKEARVFIALSNVAAFMGESQSEQFRALRKYFEMGE